MSIREISQKIKGNLGRAGDRVFSLTDWVKKNEQDLWLALVLVLVAGVFFGLGRLTQISLNHEPIKITQPAQVGEALKFDTAKALTSPKSTATEAGGSQVSSQGKYVASKSGTKYHLPSCSGAKRIKEENKIWFQTADEARSAGYTPAANCPGL
ncbi:MAG: hypothetical protein QG665_112 [Patescibacteria group bacterium]|nr:hypothetical protein [Patescibacteria group bacterium]